MDGVLVENARHDIDGDQRGEDQKRYRNLRLSDNLHRALEDAVDRGGARPPSRIAASIAVCGELSDPPGRRLKESVAAMRLPWWLTWIAACLFTRPR